MLSRILTLAMVAWLFGGTCTLANAFDFGAVAVGASASLSDDRVNNSTDSMTVSAAISGPDAADFSIVLSCADPVPPGGSCTGTVTFQPSGLGTKTAALTISTSTVVDLHLTPHGSISSDSFVMELTGVGVAGSSNLGVFDPNAGVPTTLPPVVQSVVPSGTASDLSLAVKMKFDPSIPQGSIFVGARVPPYATASGLIGGSQTQATSELRQAQDVATETWYTSNGTSWGPLGAAIPPYFTGTLNDASALINILNGANTAGLCGTEFYVGYGTSSSEMLANNTLGKVYTVMCNFDFTGSASGSASGLSLTANVQVATADAGKAGYIYVGRLMNNHWSLNSGGGWVAYNGGAVPIYTSGMLSSRQMQVFNNENVQNQVGAQIYVGYGLNEADMLFNNKYKLVHTIQ